LLTPSPIYLLFGFFVAVFVLQYWGLKPGPCARWNALPLDPCLQSFCFYLFVWCMNFFEGGGTGVQTLGLELARQALYHLIHAPSPFLLSLFFK
jgi:hypothetical protein